MEFLHLFLRDHFAGETSGGIVKCKLLSLATISITFMHPPIDQLPFPYTIINTIINKPLFSLTSQYVEL